MRPTCSTFITTRPTCWPPFQTYYETATLLDVSDPNIIWDLYEKLRGAGIFLWTEVLHFSEVFYTKSKSNAAIRNVCQPAVDRWQKRYAQAQADYSRRKDLFERAKTAGDAVLIANAEGEMKESKLELDALGIFKGDLVSLTRYYEFMSQIVDYDSPDLEMLSLYARHLAPLLRETAPDEEPIDLSSVELSHYRLSKIKQQDLKLVKESSEGLYVAGELGTGKPRNKEEIWLSQLITRLNELFVTDNLTDQDMLSYAYTLRDKMSENERVMDQITNNSPEQALLGDFPAAMDDAVMASGEAHQNQMMQYLNSKELQMRAYKSWCLICYWLSARLDQSGFYQQPSSLATIDKTRLVFAHNVHLWRPSIKPDWSLRDVHLGEIRPVWFLTITLILATPE